MIGETKQSDMVVYRTPRRILALKDNDTAWLERSSSGGAFAVLGRTVIERGGIVFGAVLNDGGLVRHEAATDLETLRRLQGSKYVAGDARCCFAEVANNVQSGRLVLFTGLPCQCAALVAHLVSGGFVDDIESCENLFVCDVVCHGTPKQKIFCSHQKWLASKVRADDDTIHGYSFRSKRQGWGLYYYYYYYYYREGKRHEVFAEASNDPYYHAFLHGLTYRRGCYGCAFARPERVSDFTIGDYWGIETAHPSFYDSKGISLVLLNTAKAEAYFDGCMQCSCTYIDSTFELASRENLNLIRPTTCPNGFDELAAEIDACLADDNLEKLFGRVLRPPITVKRIVKRLLPPFVLHKAKAVKKALLRAADKKY